ncbi:ParB/RepB/Spo0J family partition protein [Erythrobacter sp.]|uniref:ParB/RepB/Spo0J family partition protein n=1 Tax=Erythrobacter sp. TaxID=1042 RepID=UPI00311DB9F9
MHIDQIPLDQLSVSPVNMRRGRAQPDVEDILPSIRARGVLSPLFVRALPARDETDRYEILAGRRRYVASLAAAKECDEQRSLPCIVIGQCDDAEALEISMIENLLREAPDEVTQWESFTRLVKKGRGVEDIAASFALTPLQVKRILALGNLLPRIREAYRAGDIDVATLRHLTLASKARQKAWLELFDDAEARAPRGGQLKGWLFGGSSISTEVALFDLDSYPGEIVADLFGEHGYFADSKVFWEAQMAEVEQRKAAYLAAGWSGVVVVPATEHFARWEYEHAARRKGGKVYIQLRANGEVAVHEGYLSRREARAAQRAANEGEAATKRPEMTAAQTAYVDLHRHAAVGARLANEPALALRVMVAHAIAGSPLWQVRPADTASRDAATAQSLAASPAAQAIAERRRAILDMLGLEGEALCRHGHGPDLLPVLHRLLQLEDSEVMQAMALAMAETLAIGSEVVEQLGMQLGIAMTDHWQADEAFFGLLRDKEVLVAILGELGGAALAAAHAKETGATLKRLIGDHLSGEGGRPKVERWVPRWMAFPPAAYSERGGVATVGAARRAAWQVEGAQQEGGARDDAPPVEPVAA